MVFVEVQCRRRQQGGSLLLGVGGYKTFVVVRCPALGLSVTLTILSKVTHRD